MADRYWQVVLQDGKDLPDAIWRCGGVKIRRCAPAENTCKTPRPELQSDQPEMRNAFHPGPVKNDRFGAGSVFDHINDYRQRRNTCEVQIQRCLKSEKK